MSRRRKRRKSGKRLAYGVIAAVFILACVLSYFYLHRSNQTPSDQTPPTLSPRAAIVDHLSFKEETENETFVNASKNILEKAGFNLDYYPGETVTVDFYRNLAWHDYGLIVLRVHSAIISAGPELGLFTSELFDETKYNTTSAPYYDDVINNRIVRAYFPEDPTQYFAIGPRFIEEYANFQNAVIVMMGCDGLKYDSMVEAFRIKGAKVCIGWDGPVSTPHTDHATICLLQRLAQGDTIEKAVDKTMSEVGPEKLYNSSLKYYPAAAGSYTIQYTISISSMDIIRTNTVLVKKEKN